MTRRLIYAFGLAAVAVLSISIRGQSCQANPIVCENGLTGNPSSEWDVSGSGDSSLQGFATEISVNKGETVHFKVDTTAATFQIDIFRLGYYGGRGARRIATLSNITGRHQASCMTVGSTGLIDCGNWLESASWSVPVTAVSGIYLARLSRSGGGASHIVFIVRDDAAQADLLFQTSDTTWQAYNTYGGNSLYVGGPGSNPGRAYKVSYNRPFTTRGTGAEDWLFNAEYPMVRWLEANGYNVSYVTGVDTDRIGATELTRHRVFLSVGHDEYWSGRQRTNVEAARAAGVHLAFFSGNEIFWKTRWEASVDGSNTPYRTLVSYKETHANAKIDPQTTTWTGTWRDPRSFNPEGPKPENALTGTIFTVNCCTTGAAIRVTQASASQPFWRNTRVATLPVGGSTTLTAGTLGYEWDENLNNGSRPAGLITLSSTPLTASQKLLDYGSTYGNGNATHALTLYRHTSGALVFSAGTVQWAWGLDGTHDRGGSTPDVAMRQAMVNLLSDMTVQPGSLQPGLIPGAPGAPDFTIAVNPATRLAAPGVSTTFTVTSGVTNGFAGTLVLSASGLPGTWTTSFSPPSVSAGGSSTLTVTTPADTPNGSSTITITATSGALTHTTSAALVVSNTPPGQGAIGINFVGSGTAMGAAEVAGVVPRANWNNATGAARSTPLALLDETGSATVATLTWTSNNAWSTPIADEPGNGRLMKGYLDTSGSSTTTAAIAGLPLGSYDVYVHADGDNGGATRTGGYRISGSGITTTTVNLTDAAGTNFNGTFTQAANTSGNYVKFSVNATGFTLTATPGTASDGNPRAPLNAIQIVPTAPPTPDFTISVTPGSRTVNPGGVASYTVSVGSAGGFAGTVTLGVGGLPADATALFTPPTVTGAGTATLDITTSASTTSSNSTLTITGMSGALTHSVTTGLVVSLPSAAAVVSINFVGNGTAMGTGESAGVVAKPFWNNATGATRTTPLALVNETGAASGATVTWTANNVWSTPVTDQAGNRRAMKGYLDTSTTSVTTVTIAGLPAGTYDVYVYADGDNGSATRTGGYGISGGGITATTINLTDPGSTNFNATFTQATNSNGNYVKFTVSATGFVLTATPGTATDGNKRAPLNAIQIVPVP